MGCTTSPVSCQPPPAPVPAGQDGTPQDGALKVPVVPSSLERLSQATGGMEKSWYRCIFPFGLISLVIGVATTAVTFTYDALPQVRVMSLVLLGVGFGLGLLATLCWVLHKKKRRRKKEGLPLDPEQSAL